jgi:hypothetical protein
MNPIKDRMVHMARFLPVEEEFLRNARSLSIQLLVGTVWREWKMLLLIMTHRISIL